MDIKCTGCRHNPHPKKGELADEGGYPCNGCNTRILLIQLDQTMAGMFKGNRYFTKKHQIHTLLNAPKCPYNNLTKINVEDLMRFYELTK